MKLQQNQPTLGVTSLKDELGSIFGETLSGSRKKPDLEDVLAAPFGEKRLRFSKRLFGPYGSINYMIDSDGNKYMFNSGYLDFIGGKQKLPWEMSMTQVGMEGTFQNPLVSFLYERGWRDAFKYNGFPGIEKEFQEVSQLFQPIEGPEAVILDLSCGSGLMTRQFVKSCRYGRVIGADLSQTMLAETVRRFKAENLKMPYLVRCDVANLPILSGSVGGVHAGAALHCWFNLDKALKEVYRVLKPGGFFYASTFLTSATNIRTTSGPTQWIKLFELNELEQAIRNAGFDKVKVQQYGRGCVIAKCKKSSP